MPILRMQPTDTFDGTFRDQCWMEGDTFVRRRSQPGRNEAMQQIATIQKYNALQNHAETSMGRWALSIPKADFWNLVAINPDLNCGDTETMDRAWRKFTASPESIPYRITQ